jgi:hypothetical protein
MIAVHDHNITDMFFAHELSRFQDRSAGGDMNNMAIAEFFKIGHGSSSRLNVWAGSLVPRMQVMREPFG